MIMPFGLKQALDNMKNSVEALKLTNASQNKMIQIQVEQIVKQTVLMESWADSAERQAAALEKLVGIAQELSAKPKL